MVLGNKLNISSQVELNRVEEKGVQLNSWTGLCCKSQAFSVLDGTE